MSKELDKKLENLKVITDFNNFVWAEFSEGLDNVDSYIAEMKQAFIDEGWSPNIPAKNKSDMERILSVKREADIMDVRLLAISTPLYDDETPQTTQLGSTYGIDHVIGMVHQPMYYRLLDDKRGTMTRQQFYDNFLEAMSNDEAHSLDQWKSDPYQCAREAAKKAAGIE